jgi:hypothetical protein
METQPVSAFRMQRVTQCSLTTERHRRTWRACVPQCRSESGFLALDRAKLASSAGLFGLAVGDVVIDAGNKARHRHPNLISQDRPGLLRRGDALVLQVWKRVLRIVVLVHRWVGGGSGNQSNRYAASPRRDGSGT